MAEVSDDSVGSLTAMSRRSREIVLCFNGRGMETISLCLRARCTNLSPDRTLISCTTSNATAENREPPGRTPPHDRMVAAYMPTFSLSKLNRADVSDTRSHLYIPHRVVFEPFGFLHRSPLYYRNGLPDRASSLQIDIRETSREMDGFIHYLELHRNRVRLQSSFQMRCRNPHTFD